MNYRGYFWQILLKTAIVAKTYSDPWKESKLIAYVTITMIQWNWFSCEDAVYVRIIAKIEPVILVEFAAWSLTRSIAFLHSKTDPLSVIPQMCPNITKYATEVFKSASL